MIKKYTYGKPFNTESVVKSITVETSILPYFKIKQNKGISFSYTMEKDHIVYGLGEAMRGINKRGWIYESYCSDEPNHTEATMSLYGAHNFLLLDSTNKDELFGVFFDYPGKLVFDIGYTKENKLTITSEKPDINVYIINGNSTIEIVKNFRQLIGKSYIPPFWAFGFQQSKWGYKNKEDIQNIVDNYKKLNIPLDSVCIDIDYMERYKDFTIDEKAYPNFKDFLADMKKEGIRLIPIIDAGVKIEEGYDVYEEGINNNYFCIEKDGTPFTGAVWPGLTHFPDFLNEDARKWFGSKYKVLTDLGVEGFWNDMNEPAIFYSEKGLKDAFNKIDKYKNQDLDIDTFFKVKNIFNNIANSPKDYKSFYHNINGNLVCHDDVHNLYGYNMTRSAADGLDKIEPDKRILLYSRASFIGMHRYSGIWTGDNHSWWSHILLHLQMMPSLNMCGFLYIGADLGGFGCHSTRDLALRWLALGAFTPLMRNHSAIGTRDQEFYQFENEEDFKNMLEFRYRLIPYIYSEYMKAALNDDMFFRPLSFDYPKNKRARSVEDQIMVGGELMIAPVYTQNASGRYVYIPEDMIKVRLTKTGALKENKIKKGEHYINIPLNEIVFFIKPNCTIPLCNPAQCTDQLNLDPTTFEFLGTGKTYKLYSDDGFTKNYNEKSNWSVLKNE